MQASDASADLPWRGLTSCRPSTFKTALRHPFQQLFTRAQLQNVQPGPTESASLRRRAPGGLPNPPKPAQHAAAFVVHRPLNGRTGPSGQPRRVAHHQRAFGPRGTGLAVAARRGSSDPGAASSRAHRPNASWSVATTRCTPRRASTADSTRAHAHINASALLGSGLRRPDPRVFPHAPAKNAVVRVNAAAGGAPRAGFPTPSLRHSWAPPGPAAHAAKATSDSRGGAPGPVQALAQSGAAQRAML